VVREAGGSRSIARQAAELGKKADLVASADYQVIDRILRPDFARFDVHFATNEMALAYTDRSRYRREINATNWPEILLRKGVRVGHSNPNLDPCGYRTMFVVQLAEKYYRIPGFFRKLFGYPGRYVNGRERRGKVVVRPKETDLLALLESGAIDYLFIYRSVAEQHGLPYLSLPPKISLGSADEAPYYRRAHFEVTGQKPGQWIEKRGAPMVYGFTIPQSSTLPPHPKGAAAFGRFLLSPEGQAILKRNGQGVIVPPVIDGNASILEGS